MTLAELNARRQRLWFNGRKSSELEIVAPPTLRKRVLDKNERIARVDRYWNDHRTMRAYIAAAVPPPRPQPVENPVDKYEEPPVLPRRISVREIVSTVSKFYGVTAAAIVSPRRHGPTVRARQVVYYLAYELTPCSMPQIGHHLGGRDHTTCLSGIRKMNRLIPVDRELADEIAYLTDMVRGE